MSIKDESLIFFLKQFILPKRRKLFEKKINLRTNYLTVVLEDIFQPRNISACIRSADCFGIQNVHIIENQNHFYNDTEVSMGSEKWVTINHYKKKENNSISTVKKLKEKGYKIIATTPHNSNCNLYNLNITNKTALIFGSEVNGCSEKILKIADKKMKIPMYGFTESFNISVALALCLQHLTYKMKKMNIPKQLTDKEKNIVMLQWLRNSIKSSKELEKTYITNHFK